MPHSGTLAWLMFVFFFGIVRTTSAGMTTDIEYARIGDTKLWLDANVPDGDGPFPVVVCVHGGGWASGDKQADTQVIDVLKAANVVFFSINYRLAPTDRWPACFEDVKTAVRWAKANAAKYNGDPGRIALVGYSAGGQLALLAAMTLKNADAVQAAVGLAPPTDFELDLPQRGGLSKALQDLLNRPKEITDDARKQLREMSPVHHVRAGLPPLLVLHGTADKSVPYAGSQTFQAVVRKAGGVCDLVTLPGAEHRLRDWRQRDADYGKKITTWLTATLNAPATQPHE